MLEETKGKTKEENPALDEGQSVLNKEEELHGINQRLMALLEWKDKTTPPPSPSKEDN